MADFDSPGVPRPECSMEGCHNEARWRQFNPPSRIHPLYLCTDHWLIVRMDRPELIVAYGWLQSFPRQEWTDPYEHQAPALEKAAYEVPAEKDHGRSSVIGGKKSEGPDS